MLAGSRRGEKTQGPESSPAAKFELSATKCDQENVPLSAMLYKMFDFLFVPLLHLYLESLLIP